MSENFLLKSTSSFRGDSPKNFDADAIVQFLCKVLFTFAILASRKSSPLFLKAGDISREIMRKSASAKGSRIWTDGFLE